jgi:fermentation-respiration switch protein FrsA (DUF1100 family)
MTNEITFTSHGVRCAAWHVRANTDALARVTGRPCVVMAHGFGGTRDTGLLGYAESFADAGIDAFVFDYRGYGDSEGLPRQDFSFRLVLWGTSYSGGHVVVVAAQDGRVAAVVSMTPATDGLASLAQIARYAGVGQLVRAAGHGLRDVARALTKRSPHHVPVVGPPRSVAMISTPGAEEAYTSMAGPTWRNAVCARTALEVGLNRPTTFAGRLACPMLMQVGTKDRVAPPDAARRTAKKAGPRAQLREYPVDHFDVYQGPWQQRALADQLDFLSHALDPSRSPRHRTDSASRT